MQSTFSLIVHSTWRQIKIVIVALLVYLIQTCVMPYLQVFDVTPSLMMAFIAVIIVSFGRLRAFWIGAIYGILLEVMQPTVSLLNLLLYPLTALLCSVLFSDKNEQRLEYERGIGRSGRNVHPYIRIPLCTSVEILIYETVNLIYVFLRGAQLNSGHIGRALLNVILSTAIALLIMVPLRSFFHIRTLKQVQAPTPKPYRK